MWKARAPRNDLTQQRFGKLLVLERQGSAPNGASTTPTWLCQCDCGKQKLIRGPNLCNGQAKSCGCSHFKHNAYTGRGNKTGPEYRAWSGMLQRCTNPKAREFVFYGARGIRVCDRWKDAAMFLADMGPRPSPQHSLDRIDNNGNYEPGNCRWATRIEQARNKRSNRVLIVEGRALPISEWAEATGLLNTTIRERIRRGWSPRKAVLTPVPSSRRAGLRPVDTT
jgi:hypothetical protein